DHAVSRSPRRGPCAAAIATRIATAAKYHQRRPGARAVRVGKRDRHCGTCATWPQLDHRSTGCQRRGGAGGPRIGNRDRLRAMREAAILERLAGGRPIVELAHARQRTSGELGVLRRDGAVTAICAHRANLERLPEAIGELAALERLDVGDNRLSELPALPASLRELYVYDNQLVRLPALPALQVLDANRNRLAEVAAIRDVSFVYLAGNRLTAAPATSGVRYLNVGDNPLGHLAAADAAIEELRAEAAELVSLGIE